MKLNFIFMVTIWPESRVLSTGCLDYSGWASGVGPEPSASPATLKLAVRS
jgi:hypothetical protein